MSDPLPDNPQPAAARDFQLDAQVLAATGRDARAFLQAQLMNDVDRLGDGQWQWNGWLTPKGRVIALCALLRRDDATFWLVLPDADAGELASALRRYVFRSKVLLEPRLDLNVAGAFGAPDAARGAQAAIDGDRVELDLSGASAPRRVRIGGAVTGADDAERLRWQAADLRHGLPRLAGAQLEAWTPQQLSLDRLGAYSVKKGCYPGQEIVARTHFLGHAKRGVACMEASAPMSVGHEVVQDGKPIGSVVASAGATALAVLPLDHPAGDYTVDGQVVRPVPLLGGLAR